MVLGPEFGLVAQARSLVFFAIPARPLSGNRYQPSAFGLVIASYAG
jgi:hypothetical protein